MVTASRALFAWIVQAFVGAIAGFVLLLQRRPLRMGMHADGPLPAVSTPTALLVPIYNEDPARLMAGVQAMHESLEATGQLGRFHVVGGQLGQLGLLLAIGGRVHAGVGALAVFGLHLGLDLRG